MKITEFTQKVEVSGRETFRRLARASDNPGVRKIFDTVARDEESLAKEMTNLQDAAGVASRKDSRALEELTGELQALTERTRAERVDNDVAAYDLAARYEEGVCRILGRAAEQEDDADARGLLRKIEKIECGEARELRNAYDFVNAPNEYLAWREFSNLEEFGNFGREEV